MKKERLSFLKKFFLVITDFRTYPFLVKHEKFLKSFIYLLTLTLIVSIIFTSNVLFKLSDTLNYVVQNYDEIVPEFELSSGNLKVDTKYSNKLNNESYIVVDTNYTYDEYIKTKEYSSLVIYDTITLINSDKIIVELGEEALSYGIEFKDLNYEINKNTLYDELKNMDKSIELVPYLITVYVSIFIGYFIVILTRILFLSCLISIICFLTGIRLNFANYIKIAIYSYTLPLIVELISLCLIGTIKDYAYYTTLILTYIYIIYAIRAIRLDAFIMLFSKKNKKNTPEEFQTELKKYNDLVNKEETKEDDKVETKDDNKNEK